MAQAKVVSLAKFTSAVQSAVKAAAAKHPKFKLEVNAVALGYLIQGFPVPEPIAAAVSLAETRAFADDVAAHLGGGAEAGALAIGGTVQGSVFSHGGHLILGFPVPPEVLFER